MILVPFTNDLTAGKVKQINIRLPPKVVVIIPGLLINERNVTKEAIERIGKFAIFVLSHKNRLIELYQITNLENFVFFEKGVCVNIVQ